MNALKLLSRKLGCILLVLLLVTIGTAGASRTQTASAATAGKAYVYYVSNEVLYRVTTDGSETQKIAENFDGNGLMSTGKYLYFYYESIMGIQRLSLTDPDALITNFSGDRNIVYFLIDGDFLYFMDDTGSIYRTSANAEDDTQLTRVADNADANFQCFDVLNGRIYYNALKDTTTTWVASKPSDGSGAIQWIASGAIQDASFIHPYGASLNLMIDTISGETEYSLNSKVLYTLPLSGGAPKAANAKSPLDSNEVYAGTWSNNYFLFNKGIKLDAKGENNFSTGKGFLIDKNGKILQLSQNSVLSISELSNTKLAYVDSKGKAYISTLANGKIASSKALALTNVINVQTVKNGTTLTTIFYTKTDAYVLNADSTLTKMAGVESDYSVITNDIPGIYYINAGDNDCLYRFSNDGKTKTKLSAGPVTFIGLLSTH
ncbi:DUF5050 domain-containing protein [Paenibacillus sp. FSL E2-0178]|uniref:DUF5050 domain-containing protein n=1 Tax=Paenibacillus sp. FSL E2-0178 TaxID=2921361 RepID=UPI003159667E